MNNPPIRDFFTVSNEQTLLNSFRKFCIIVNFRLVRVSASVCGQDRKTAEKSRDRCRGGVQRPV
jgi:hypothetical protein